MRQILTLWCCLMLAPRTVHAAPQSKPKPQPQSEAQVTALRQQLKTHGRLLREIVTGVGENAVKAPFGRFLLIKDGDQCLAFRITEHVNFRIIKRTQIYTAKYEWCLQTDGSMDFSKANVQRGNGEVTEFKDERYAPDYIKAGTFPVLEWSSGDWIYFTVGPTPVGGHPPGSQQATREKNIRMASTEWVRLEDVDPHSKSLMWLSKALTKGLSR